MDVFRALAIAKGSEEKKVGFNLQIPVSLKDELDQFCKINGVSMTAMINGMIQSTMEEVARNPYYQESTLAISEKLEQLNLKLEDYEIQVKYSESGDFVNTPQNNSIQREINSLEIQIKALEAELKRRSE
jgi:antitoxin component YwqK of YwqJK toxin-antitoxin module